MSEAGSRDLVVVQDAEQPVLEVVCLPYAASGAGQFRPWRGRFPDDFKVVAVQLPGRESRVAEAPLTDATEVVARVVAHLADGEAGVVLLGVCSGALLAHAVASELTVRRRVAGVVALGQAAPSAVDFDAFDQQLAEPDGRRLLTELGEVPPALLEDDDVVEMLEPAARGDLAVVSGLRAYRERIIDTPITAWAGIDDTAFTDEEIAAWSRHSTEEVVTSRLPGGHGLQASWARLPELVTERLALGKPA